MEVFFYLKLCNALGNSWPRCLEWRMLFTLICSFNMHPEGPKCVISSVKTTFWMRTQHPAVTILSLFPIVFLLWWSGYRVSIETLKGKNCRIVKTLGPLTFTIICNLYTFFPTFKLPVSKICPWLKFIVGSQKSLRNLNINCPNPRSGKQEGG